MKNIIYSALFLIALLVATTTHAQTPPPAMVPPPLLTPKDVIAAPAAPTGVSAVPAATAPVAPTTNTGTANISKDPLTSLSTEVKTIVTASVPAKVVDTKNIVVAEKLHSNVSTLTSKLEGAIAKLEGARVKISAKTTALDAKNPKAREALVKFDEAYTALTRAKIDVTAIALVTIPVIKPQSALPALQTADLTARASIRTAQAALIEALAIINAVK